jgi:formylglycine-generating enzyme required for sulfatase activity
MGETFTNAASFFDAEYVADSNGMIRVEVPMFFRVQGEAYVFVPEGMLQVPEGVNSGADPEFGAYSLTNESAFYMDATEVTKAQWDEVYTWATNNSYSFSNAGSGKATNHPVHSVSWYDCVKWCNARSEMDGQTPCYTVSGSIYKTGESTPDCDLDAGGYRLPNSTEWEYAARGGLSGKRFPWGDTITHSNANYYSDSSYSYDISATRQYHPDYDDDVRPYTNPAGAFAANGYGLFDMSGNLLEFCNDWYPGYEGTLRIMRGGCWYWDASTACCGLRKWITYKFGYDYIGFRTVFPVQ